MFCLSFINNVVAAKVAERKEHTILDKKVTVELVAARKSLVTTKASQETIVISNVSDDISDDLLFLYIDKFTELDGEGGGDYTITRKETSQVVVSFSATAELPPGGMFMCK